MNSSKTCAKCACTLTAPSLPICQNGHRMCEQCQSVYSHVDRYACPECGSACYSKEAELRSIDGGYQESTINMDQQSQDGVVVGNFGRKNGNGQSSQSAEPVPEACTPWGCIRGLLLASLVWTSAVLNCVYYFNRTQQVGQEVAVFLLFMLLCQFYQYGYAQIPTLRTSLLARVKALLKHLFFFPFVVEGQPSHFSKAYSLKELVLAIAVIAIEKENDLDWEKLGVLTLVFNIAQFLAVAFYTFRPLAPTV